jgi:hypothetical protein
MLLAKAQPTSAIVFVDDDQDGNAHLAVELAQIYYRLSKEERQELKLGPDWKHHWDA